MQIQMSYATENEAAGNLYIVPTPIGNLDDITIRALNTLKSVDTIAAEDTRHTKKLLNHFSINKPLLSYHEHNKMMRTDEIITAIQEGKDIALVSDAGMPAISDPGYDLVVALINEHLNVIVLPGANAALCALVGSGLSTDEFYFYGFLPRKNSDKTNDLKRLQSIQATLLFYESPYRIEQTITSLAEYFGNRKVVIAREITKLHEEYIRGTFAEVSRWLSDHSIKGECCIVVEGNNESHVAAVENWWGELSIIEHVKHYEAEENLKQKEAMKRVAIDRNIGRRDVYKAIHIDN